MEKMKKLIWIGRIVSGLAVLPFVPSGVMKLLHHPDVIKGITHLGLPESLITPLGILELTCVGIYLIPKTAVLGSILLTGYVGGAILAHLRIGEPVFLQITLGVLVWLGLYLRERRLREILPLRKPQD
jgi:hypothetical protein